MTDSWAGDSAGRSHPGQRAAARSVVRAVDSAIADLAPADLVLVACSGGADSLGLAIAAGYLAATGRIRAGAVVVDHQLQAGSGPVASQAAAHCRALGLDPVDLIPVDVPRGPGAGGLEAAARGARREALVAAAQRYDAKALLLAHTLEDQAETVLLGLARGSGARSLAGIAPRSGLWRRPLLDCYRADVRAVCAEAGIAPYEDPFNQDEAFKRVRVRNTVLPVMERELGRGVSKALARTAALLRADCEALDQWAQREFEERVAARGSEVRVTFGPVSRRDSGGAGALLAELPAAVRGRVLRSALLAAGCPAGSLTQAHIERVDRLVTRWRGQGAVRVPGDREVRRASAKLVIHPAEPLHKPARPTEPS